ncbi:MAG: bifunctional (p)ppGpp synthetase/guanosine-3',5'-bis(diphosphate) 3'-pyrophosphohydrolase, partial [Eubacteriales bacterium]|nr:bifunctional (p)ppGpp synthetase/guanosine-3',5'-bis(diphosphate) 3'-pyrophosphohydrolase [Eubacteriales bacterium]
LADLELDCTSIVAALLHDTIEDTTYTYDMLAREFGEETAKLVEGVTKLGRIPYSTREELQAENLRKMFLAMAKDIRVILIKLADRLHNMRTLRYKSYEKQVETARETLEIFAPLAHRLGISRIKWEMEDICLRYIDPKGYYSLVRQIAQKRQQREEYIKKIIAVLNCKMKEIGIEGSIEGRPKHFYSIYKKMAEQDKSIEQIYDLFAVRIIVDTVKDCYAVLGMVHEMYRPLPGRFKDYIAMPKPNMYQSLHTTLAGNEGVFFEVQIRTWEMHRVAEVGIAAHWKYKEGRSGGDNIDKKLSWLRQLLEWQKEMKDASEFIETLKIDLFADEVFVFTPKGDVISLPAGSSPVDFAYAIHSAVGNRMIGAKVNGMIKPLEHVLTNGDVVEIITSSSMHGPSRDWLKIAKSSQARNKINQWFKKENRDENILKGKESLERELKKQALTYAQLFKPEWAEILLKKYNFNTVEDMIAGIGFGAITANKIISRLKEEYRKSLKPDELEALRQKEKEKEQATQPAPAAHGRKDGKPPANGIIVKGIDNCLVRLSKCCNPVPGDKITGFITRGRGVSVHRSDCVNVTRNKSGEARDRLIEVGWYKAENNNYDVDITVLANDRKSLLVEISNAISEAGISMKAINARTTKDNVAIMNIKFEINGTGQLDMIIRKLKRIESVFEVTRAKI